MKKFPKRGEIYWVQLDPAVGSEIKKTRPALIISNNAGNEISSRVIVAPITSTISYILPFEVPITIKNNEGKILLDQIRSIDKSRLGSRIGTCQKELIEQIDLALKIVLALD